MLERRLSLRHLFFAGACVALACAEAENTDPDEGSGGTAGSGVSGSGGKGGTTATGGASGSGGSAKGGSGGKGGSAGTTSKGGSSGSSSSGGSGGTPTTPPIGCLDTGEGGAGGEGTAGQGGLTGDSGAAGESAGGTSGSAGTSGVGGDGGAAGAPGPIPPLFFDDFETGNAAAWTPNGNWSVVADGSNVYAGVGDGTPLFLSTVTGSCWADQIVEARIKIIDFPGMSTGYFAAVFARVVDDNGYFAAIDSSSSTKFTVRRLIDGDIEKIGTDHDVEITYGNWYDIKFEVIGTMLRATFTDDVATSVITETDTRISSGGVAVGVKNGDASFDDVRVTAP